MPGVDYYSGSGGSVDAWVRWRGQVDADRTFLEMGAQLLTYGEFDGRVDQIAGRLERAGLRAGDRVGVYMDNSFEYLASMFGILRAGLVYVPCSTLASEEELVHQLDQTGARLLFVDVERKLLGAELARRVSSLETVVTSAELATGPRPKRARAEGKNLRASSPPLADQLAMVMYSSGTTAHPKGIMFSHGNLVSIANTARHAFQWTREDRFLHFYPMYHTNGGLTGVLPALMTGAAIHLAARFTASGFGQLLFESGATLCNVNSTHVKMALAHPITEHDDRHRVWRMLLGLTLDTESIAAFERRFHTRLCPTYGTTEGCGTNMVTPPTDPGRPGSSGRLVRGYSARIVDEDGRDLPLGQAGELLIASADGHGLCLGYYGEPDLSAQLIRGGWLHTGDVGHFDADGYFWFVERRKDMIKRAGLNVAPAEVERVIADVPGVREVAVIGTPDPMREEAIVAFVVTGEDGPVTEAAVVDACRRRLAEYKVPQQVRFVNELPLNFLGKLERRTLREWALRGDA
jgi:carnitine-CoA ligase